MSTATRYRLKTLAALMAAVPLLGAQVDLVEIPDPNLTGVEAAVAAQLTESRANLDRLAGDADTAPADLAEASGSVGQLYLLHELTEVAAPCFVNAGRLASNDPRWPYYLAVIEQRDRDLQEARALFDRVLELDPENLAARVRGAQVTLEIGDLERAESRFRPLLETPTVAAAAHYGLGRIAAQRQQNEAAIDHFQSVLETQPQASAAHYQLGLVYRQIGQLEEARQHLSEYGRVPVYFPDPLIEHLAVQAQGTGVHIVRGASARAAGDLDRAVQEYRAALELDPDHLASRQALASTLFEMGEDQAGAEQLREVLGRDPDNPSAHYNLGTVLFRQGELDEALTHLMKAVQLAPDFADGWANLALVLERLGRFEEAVQGYAEAIDLEPGDMRLRLQRAAALSRAGRTEEAVTDMETILDREPDNAQALFGLGMALAASGRTDDAIVELQRILELDSTPGVQASVHLNLGILLAEAERAEEAIPQLRRALTLNPDLIPARARLANLLAYRGRFEEAAREFGDLARLQPANPQFRFGQAVSLLLAERYPEALATLEDAVARFPTSLGSRNALARLLAACPEDDLRDGNRALLLAEEILETRADPEYTETLAMALAELGRFDEAVELQSQLVGQARTAGLDDLVPTLEARLELYRSGRPCRAPWLPTR